MSRGRPIVRLIMLGFGLTVSSNYWQCYVVPGLLIKSLVGVHRYSVLQGARYVIPRVSSCVSCVACAHYTHLAVPLYSRQAAGSSLVASEEVGGGRVWSAGTGLPGATVGRSESRPAFTGKLNAGDCKCHSQVTGNSAGAAAFLATTALRRGVGLPEGEGGVGCEGRC